MESSMEQNNKLVMDLCQKGLFICYLCPKCGLMTYGKATSYHQQVHGTQQEHWRP
jgi:hypothetical protein